MKMSKKVFKIGYLIRSNAQNLSMKELKDLSKVLQEIDVEVNHRIGILEVKRIKEKE